MKNFEALSNKELKEINGGIIGIIIGAIACYCGAVYLAGEIAESAGRSYRKNYLE